MVQCGSKLPFNHVGLVYEDWEDLRHDVWGPSQDIPNGEPDGLTLLSAILAAALYGIAAVCNGSLTPMWPCVKSQMHQRVSDIVGGGNDIRTKSLLRQPACIWR